MGRHRTLDEADSDMGHSSPRLNILLNDGEKYSRLGIPESCSADFKSYLASSLSKIIGKYVPFVDVSSCQIGS